MYKKVNSFFDKDNIICDLQYDFRTNHSTEYAILDISNQIQTNMDKKLFSWRNDQDIFSAFFPRYFQSGVVISNIGSRWLVLDKCKK